MKCFLKILLFFCLTSTFSIFGKDDGCIEITGVILDQNSIVEQLKSELPFSSQASLLCCLRIYNPEMENLRKNINVKIHLNNRNKLFNGIIVFSSFPNKNEHGSPRLDYNCFIEFDDNENILKSGMFVLVEFPS